MTVNDYELVISEICNFAWSSLNQEELSAAALAYYYFSVQFRENLEIAASLYPDDKQIAHLIKEECDTANLSPWPHVAKINETLNHDEFMRRALLLNPIDPATQARITNAGEQYLQRIRAIDDTVRV